MDKTGRLAEVKVGAFVLMALTVLVVGALWIAGFAFRTGRGASYDVLITDSGGIKTGDRVRLAGVEVGRVKSVTLRPTDEHPVVFRVGLDPGITLRTDATASIATTGLLGSNFLRIDPGSPEAPVLPPGGAIHGYSSLGLEETLARVDQISGRVLDLVNQTAGILDQVSKEIDPLLDRVEQLLSQQNVDNLSHLLVDVHQTMEESGPRLSALVTRLDTLTGHLDQGMESVPEMAGRINDLVGQIQTAIGPDGERLAGLLDAGESGLDSASEALGFIMTNRSELEASLRDLREVASNLKAFSQQVKERPYSLIRIRPLPDRRPGEGVEGSPGEDSSR